MKQKPKPPASTEAAGPKSSIEQAFELRFTPDAAADIQSLDGSIRNQLRKVLEKKLAVNPEEYGLPLRGSLANFWKHEFANHRVIYRIYPQLRVVAICAVGIRKQGDMADIYRQLESVAKSGRLAEQLASVLKKILPET
ncbi:MAG TPA: type II toxin-antitoxin system RelE/ParE family toxin [Candidatus Sulfotelmatobacter sp.]|jgi:mRNA-degrading endonuclease RelE of RelBE toxin-antitoxin system|nr:type II toxin-antitoxin system RelE/ParE family toxin [Candidatus Sulfotelmatobacter sp.]